VPVAGYVPLTAEQIEAALTALDARE